MRKSIEEIIDQKLSKEPFNNVGIGCILKPMKGREHIGEISGLKNYNDRIR